MGHFRRRKPSSRDRAHERTILSPRAPGQRSFAPLDLHRRRRGALRSAIGRNGYANRLAAKDFPGGAMTTRFHLLLNFILLIVSIAAVAHANDDPTSDDP